MKPYEIEPGQAVAILQFLFYMAVPTLVGLTAAGVVFAWPKLKWILLGILLSPAVLGAVVYALLWPGPIKVRGESLARARDED